MALVEARHCVYHWSIVSFVSEELSERIAAVGTGVNGWLYMVMIVSLRRRVLSRQTVDVEFGSKVAGDVGVE